MRTEPDAVTLTNESGGVLRDCQIVVKPRGKGGQTYSHVHHVEEWAEGRGLAPAL